MRKSLKFKGMKRRTGKTKVSQIFCRTGLTLNNKVHVYNVDIWVTCNTLKSMYGERFWNDIFSKVRGHFVTDLRVRKLYKFLTILKYCNCVKSGGLIIVIIKFAQFCACALPRSSFSFRPLFRAQYLYTQYFPDPPHLTAGEWDAALNLVFC